jgi:hypothetical protein
MEVMVKSLAAIFILLALASSGAGQKRAHPDDYLNNEIVTIKGKVIVFSLREGNEPSVGNQWGLIFQRADCKKCFIYTQADCDGNYKIQVSRGKYRVIARYGNRIGEMVDTLAPSQTRTVDATPRTPSSRDIIFNVKIVLPFKPIKITLPEGVVTPCDAPNNGMHPTADTLLVKLLNRAARRVMPGVRPLVAEHKI